MDLAAALRRALLTALLPTVALLAPAGARAAIGDVTTFTAGVLTPAGLTAVGGDLYYVGTGTGAVVRMTPTPPAGTVTSWPVDAAAQPEDLTFGPDGNLWLTERNANKIGRMTTTGVLTEFAIPTASSQPTGIALGPDGKLWFTESNANKIGSITTAGVITEYALTPGRAPFRIVAGPDGNLWFTERNASRIGRITTAGDVTEFAVPTPSSAPYEITEGPDGNLWFTELTGARIGRVSPSGVITEFPLAPGRHPTGIATGPDGNLWFTDQSAGLVGRITIFGAVAEHPAGFAPQSITAGPDDSMWVGDVTPHQILKVFAGVPQATLSTAAVDFGTVTLGTTVQRTVTVHNTGTGDLAISSVRVYGADADKVSFGAATTCADRSVLAPDASCDVVLDFASGTTLGDKTAALTIADTASGSPRSVPLTATVAPPPPTAATGAATDVSVDGATLTGLATPNGAATSAHFEYGTTDAYGSVTEDQDLGDGDDGVAVHAALHGLAAGTTYHFRLVATSASGTTRGADGTFTTEQAPVTPPPAVDPQPDAPTQPTAPTTTATPPAATPLAPLVLTARPAAVLAGHSARIAFTSPTGRAECRVDGGPWIACASPFAIDRLVAGDHVLSVRALDAGGAPVGDVAHTRFQINPNAPTIRVLGGRTLTASTFGVVALRVRCSPREGGGRGACIGTVGLRLRGGRSLGRAVAFRAAAGQATTVAIKLPSTAIRRLPRQGSGTRVTVVVDAKDLAGNHRRTTATRTLRRHR